jgi:hypothetical protein
MLACARRVLAVAPLLALGAIACTSSGSLSSASRSFRPAIAPLSPTARVIDGERIARSGVQTALDALRLFVHDRRLTTSAPGVTSLTAPGVDRNAPRVIVDGHPIGDVELLRLVPAREILVIHVLNAADAIIRFGPHYEGGAVIIQTMASMWRP